jgi:hypothetical protein
LLCKPQQFLRVTRTGEDGRERIAFIGYIDDAVHDAQAGTTQLKARAPESLILESCEAPFPLPLPEHIGHPPTFEFWWKQLGYVFELPDPRTFPPLPDNVPDDERAIVERFVHVAGDLAASGLLNALSEGFNVQLPDGSVGPEAIETNFSRTDLQAGFAVLLRQCDLNESASFHRVRTILNARAHQTYDDFRNERIAQLKVWRDAGRALRAKSLNQLIREKLVADEGMGALAYDEEHRPETLLELYNYGDLIHWDSDESGAILAGFERDPFTESDRRLAFLEGASGLAHLYVGFAELARTAVGRVLPPEETQGEDGAGGA